MSNISTAYDAIRTTLETLFPNKTELSDPRELENNINNLLVDGYGLQVGTLDPGAIDILKESNTSQKFIVIFTKEMVRTDGDNSVIHTCTKALLENEVTTRLEFLKANQLNQLAAIDKIEFIGRTEINNLRAGKQNFIYIETTFGFDLAEDI